MAGAAPAGAFAGAFGLRGQISLLEGEFGNAFGLAKDVRRSRSGVQRQQSDEKDGDQATHIESLAGRGYCVTPNKSWGPWLG